MQIDSPPRWDDAPVEFQADLAALERMDDEALWRVARSHETEADVGRYQELLDRNANGALSPDECAELVELRVESDRFMLCKAHAAALLRWRGHLTPPAETLRDGV